MINKKIFFAVSLFMLLLGCGEKNISTELDYYDLLSSKPIQEELDEKKVFNDEGFTINAAYSYQISARVLRKENYSWDRLSAISPVDLALGWNKMSDEELLEKSKISISQGTRFYFWKLPDFNVLERKEISENSANVHIIPANEKIKEYLEEEVENNDLIYLEGYLVNVEKDVDGRKWYMKTSTTRKDTGAGACEIIYVTKVVHLIDKS